MLHHGGIAEMRTGEGKTLVATAPVYLNALAGKGVHVITVNDYLARRDADWMGQVYSFLGLTYGVIVNGLSQGERQRAYNSDITYGTNNEFGFDYLRDNLVYDKREMVQRGHAFVIVDEVDSILIDEARTPSDHLRPHRGSLRLLPHHRPRGEGADQGQGDLRLRREAEAGHPDRAGQRRGGGDADRRRPSRRRFGRSLRPGQHLGGPPRQSGAAGQHHLHARQGLHRPRRRDHADRRVHRPHDAGPSPVRRPAPGHRGQGERRGAAGEPDPGLRHHPELLPSLRQTLRHDRHGGHRGGGIRRHLQDGRVGNPHQQADPAHRRRRRGLSHRSGEEPVHRQADP